MLTEKQKVEMIEWLKILLLYIEGKKKWDTGGPWVCESHPLMPHDKGYSFDCKCGAPGMGPFVPKDFKEEIECPDCKSPLEDNGVCSDVGSNNCQYQA